MAQQHVQQIKTMIPPNQRQYDDARLVAMVEPLMVRVERVRGSHTTPMPLPSTETGDAPGTGWTKEDVRNLETWIVRECGGGIYDVKVTDSSIPPITMPWRLTFDEREYPAKTPPALAEAAGNINANYLPPPAGPTMSTPRAFPHGIPLSPSPQGYPSAPQPQMTYAGPMSYGMPPQPQIGTQAYQQWAAEADRRKTEDELKRLREEREASNLRAIEEKYKAEIKLAHDAAEGARRDSERQLRDMQTQIAQLQATIATGAATKPNAEVETLRAELAAQRAQAEAERRERDLRDLILRVEQNTQTQISAVVSKMDQTFNALMVQMKDSQQAPAAMTSFLNEQARQHADTLKEIARSNADQIGRLSAFIMTPQTMLDLAQRSSQQAESAADRVANQMGRALDMHQRVTETALQLQPSGGGGLDVIREGIGTLKDGFEKWANMKSVDAKLQQAAAQQAAELNARVYMESQRIAAMQSAQAAGVHTPPPPRVEAQLAGPAAPTPIVDVAPTVKRTDSWYLGRPDAEWFGPVLDEIEQLRLGVKEYIVNINSPEPKINDKGEPIGVSPKQTAGGVMMAVQMIAQRGVDIPAVRELLGPMHFSDFFACALPSASKAYRDACVEALIEIIRASDGTEAEDVPLTVPGHAQTPTVTVKANDDEEDEDEGEDEDENEPDDGDDAKLEEKLATTPPPKKGRPNPRQQPRS